MVFCSFIFVFCFLPLTLSGYIICEKIFPGLKNFFLFVTSMFFYAWGEPRYVFLFLLVIGINYILGFFISKKSKYSKILLTVGIICNLLILFFFKYYNFFVGNFNQIWNIKKLDVVLPIGISFYTFQLVSYLLDVYWGKVEVQSSLISFGMYISFFPQLIAGPIVRYSDVEKQLHTHKMNFDDFHYGIVRFMQGFCSKILIADQVSVIADYAFSLKSNNTLLAWLGIVAYTLQIYFDFCGYSDMAVGLGAMFGFRFYGNFRMPYQALSITEFWRRWHISLSTWFRDYVYIPLGGSRCGLRRNMVNLLVVFLLTGFWHGASWNFALWGVYYGGILIIEKIYLLKSMEGKSKLLRHIYTILIVMGGWIIFRSEKTGDIAIYIKNLFIFQYSDYDWIEYVTWENICFLLCGMIICGVEKRKIDIHGTDLGSGYEWSILILFMLSLIYMLGVGFSPFLYFRF